MSNIDNIHLLILGSPRSGTTLLSAMIGCHPDVALLNEDIHGASLTIFSKKIKGVKLCVPNQIELNQTLWMKLEDLVVNVFQLLLNPVRSFLGLRVPIRRGMKSKYSIRDYQKKTERLIVLGIVRNPYDSIKSIIGRGQQTRKTAEYRWKRLIEVLYQLSTEKNTDSELLIVEFDKLVTEPVELMKKLLPLLECDFNENVLEGFKHTPQYKGSSTISANKASKGIEYALTHPLLESDEELKNKYLHLVRESI